jgi:hypothetical protein
VKVVEDLLTLVAEGGKEGLEGRQTTPANLGDPQPDLLPRLIPAPVIAAIANCTACFAP